MTKPRPGPGEFRTTRWSLVRSAAGDGARSRAALEDLCRIYWRPLYVLARRRGWSEPDAEDLVQGFLARLLERRDLARATPERGTFRGFLTTAFVHHLANDARARRALKRGAGQRPLSLDLVDAERFVGDGEDGETPEGALERSWALLVIERALERLRGRYRARGRMELFEALVGALGGEAVPAAEVAARLGTTPGAVRVALHRLREGYRAALRAEVGRTVADPAEVDRELAALLAALRNSHRRP